MEVLESGEQGVLQWDRKLSELSEPGDGEALMYHTHFSELLDEFSQNVLGQLLNDPFLSEKSVSMEVEPSPTSPAPLIQAEHSYSLCEEPRAQSPFTHITTSDSFNDEEVESEKWYLSTDFPSTTIKTETRSVCHSDHHSHLHPVGKGGTSSGNEHWGMLNFRLFKHVGLKDTDRSSFSNKVFNLFGVSGCVHLRTCNFICVYIHMYTFNKGMLIWCQLPLKPLFRKN
uniref:cAMP responsive element binding protein 3 like 2 n=1 Tax=Pan troglodytes TaxID=9598 RepID=A0A2I3TAU8_PANTR